MSHYIYYHLTTGYETKNIVANNIRCATNDTEQKAFFGNIRTNITQKDGSNVSLYFKIDDEVVFSTISKKTDTEMRGIIKKYSELSHPPIYYSEVINANIADSEKDELRDYAIPNIRVSVRDAMASINRSKRSVLITLLDAILFDKSEKKLILLVKDENEFADYIKSLSALLPKSFIDKIGFCVGCAQVPYKLTYKNAHEELLPIPIKIWGLTDKSSLKLQDYCNVIDASDINNCTDYIRTQTALASILESYDFGDSDIVNSFRDSTECAFSSTGEFDQQRFIEAVAIWNFENRTDISSANIILTLAKTHDICKDITTTAFNILIADPNNITNILRYTFIDLYKKGKLHEDTLFNFYLSFLSRKKPVTDEEKELYKKENSLFFDLIIKEKTGKRLIDYLNKLNNPSYQINTCIRLTERIIDDIRKNEDDVISIIIKNENFVEKVIDYFARQFEIREDIKDQVTDTLINIKNKDTRTLIASFLVLSVYSLAGHEKTSLMSIRESEIIDFLDRCHTPYDKISNLIDIFNYAYIITENQKYSNYRIELINGFFLDSIGKHWIGNILKELSPSELLKIINDVLGNEINYVGLRSLIEKILLNENYVKTQIPLGSEIWEKYIKFFRPHADSGNNAIKEYLNKKNDEQDISDWLANDRCEFAEECYSTLSPANKDKIKTGLKSIEVSQSNAQGVMPRKAKEYEFDGITIPRSKRITVVESIIDTFGMVKKNNIKRKKELSPIGIWSFILAIISLVILCIPSIVLPLGLGNVTFEIFIDKFTDYFLPWFVAIPICVYLVTMLLYALSREVNKQIKLRKTIKTSILCCLLPVLCFVLAFIICYFANIEALFKIQ